MVAFRTVCVHKRNGENEHINCLSAVGSGEATKVTELWKSLTPNNQTKSCRRPTSVRFICYISVYVADKTVELEKLRMVRKNCLTSELN